MTAPIALIGLLMKWKSATELHCSFIWSATNKIIRLNRKKPNKINLHPRFCFHVAISRNCEIKFLFWKITTPIIQSDLSYLQKVCPIVSFSESVFLSYTILHRMWIPSKTVSSVFNQTTNICESDYNIPFPI